MKKILQMFILYLGFIQPVFAGLTFTGKILSILTGPAYGSSVLIEVDGDSSGERGCLPNGNFDFGFDGSTENGKIYLSTLLTAYAAQKTVRLESTSTCSYFSTVPDLESIWVK